MTPNRLVELSRSQNFWECRLWVVLLPPQVDYPQLAHLQPREFRATHNAGGCSVDFCGWLENPVMAADIFETAPPARERCLEHLANRVKYMKLKREELLVKLDEHARVVREAREYASMLRKGKA